jgi:uncharacterized protein YbjT (DUF2867 family)
MTKELVERGHSVIVISSNYKKKNDIEALGAQAAIGKLEDVEFLAEVFDGADAVYCMIRLNFKASDLITYFKNISRNIAMAIRETGIKNIILLSGWIAGIISTYKDVENILNELSEVSITHIRPGYFYSNFYESMEMIREKGIIAAAFGGEDKIVMSSPSDIADAVVDEIINPHQGIRIRYVASDEMTCNEAAKILGTAIGKPDLKWVTMTDKEMLKALVNSGLTPKFASDIVEMQAPIHKELMSKEFARHRSEEIAGKVKLKDFVKEFTEVYNKK